MLVAASTAPEFAVTEEKEGVKLSGEFKANISEYDGETKEEDLPAFNSDDFGTAMVSGIEWTDSSGHQNTFLVTVQA